MRESLILRVADDEYVQAVPGEPGAAVIVSAGYLPVRVPIVAGGVHHRPPFPGTTVDVAGVRYEVVDEENRDGLVLYALKPWPPDQIIRELVTYDRAFVAALHEERRRLARRERGRRLYWPLYPLLGALPEPEQIRWCDRWGLDPRTATVVSAAAEALVILFAWKSLRPAPAILLMGASALLVSSALMRITGALITAEVAGSPLVAAALRVVAPFRRGLPEPDVTLLPMTRPAFWARLALPDRQKREADGAVMVRSVLPHLTWQVGQRVAGEAEHWWRVTAAHTVLEHGRLVYVYRLVVEGITEGATVGDARPPRTTAYQDAVLGGVRREWDDVRTAFGWLISLLPADVQERAVGHVGGPRALRMATAASAVFFLGAAAWMAAAPTLLNLATAAVLATDAVRRLGRLAQGRYAPSLFARWVPRYMRPERLAYQAHRQAERHALGA